MKRFFLFSLTAALVLQFCMLFPTCLYAASNLSEASETTNQTAFESPDSETSIIEETYSDIEVVSSAAEDDSADDSQGSSGVNAIIEFMIL